MHATIHEEKKKKKATMTPRMLPRVPKAEFKAMENYFLALTPNQRIVNICMTGYQNFYELASSFVFPIFPFLN